MDIRSLVRQVQSQEQDVRTNAEECVRLAGAQNPGEVLNALFTFISDSSVPDGQTAMLLTKNLVVNFWSPSFAQFTGPTWDDTIKQQFRTKLLEVISLPDTKVLVRSAAVSIVSRIAGVDFPDQWPDLVEHSIAMLLNDPTHLAGLSLFRELLEDTVREQDFWQYASEIMERLFYLISNTDGVTQLYSIQCFHECMNFFLMGEDESQLDHLENLAQTQLPHWCELFSKLLKTSKNHDVIHELIDTLQDLQSGFPEIMAKELPCLLEATFDSLQSYKKEDLDECKDVIALQLDFVELMLNNSPTVLQQLREDPNTLAKFVSVCIDHACASDLLRDSWIDDFNVFITHEQELSLEVWPRPSAGLLIGAVKTNNTVSCLLQYLNQATDWPHQEACLFLLSCALQQLPIESQVIPSSDISNLLAFLAKTTGGPELLLARAIITGGQVPRYMMKLIDPESSLALLKRPADLLEHEGSKFSDLIKCSLLKTVSLGCSIYPKEFRPYQRVILSTIASLIPNAEDDTPAFLVDCFLEALRLDFEAAIRLNEVFGMFFALVAKGTANLELNAEILNLVGEFMDSTYDTPQSQLLVFNQLLSPVLSIFEQSRQNGFEYSSDLQFALDICGVVFEKCTSEVIARDKNELSKLLENLILTCQDPQILQAGSFSYTALMERSNLNELSHDDLQRILQVTAKLLGPSLEDSAALAAGRLITALLENFTDLGEVLGEVFVVAAKRMISANHAYLVESIGLAYADLFIKECPAAIGLLDSNQLLEPFMKKWISTFEVVRGTEEILKYIQALTVVFDTHDARIQEIMVDDEAICRPDGRPLTRSRGIKFTQVPIPLKIVKLLIHALDDSPAPITHNENDNEDDEWADEVIYSLDGNAIDTRAFSYIMDWFTSVGQQGMVWYQSLNNQERAILLKASKGMGTN